MTTFHLEHTEATCYRTDLDRAAAIDVLVEGGQVDPDAALDMTDEALADLLRGVDTNLLEPHFDSGTIIDTPVDVVLLAHAAQVNS